MAADLHIHVCKTDEEAAAAALFLKYDTAVYEPNKPIRYTRQEFLVNGKWMSADECESLENVEGVREVTIEGLTENVHNMALETESVWIGEVSWLKAGLFEDAETYIPKTVLEVHKLIPDLKKITPELIEGIKEAFKLPNNTIKKDFLFGGKGYSLAGVDHVVEFLEKHMGKLCYTISW